MSDSRPLPASPARRLVSYEQREWLTGYAFASPWLLGFFVLGVGPIAMSLYYSLCRYDVLRPRMFVGLENYLYLLFDSPKFYTSIANTLYFTLLRVPLVIAGSLAIALLVASRPTRSETTSGPSTTSRPLYPVLRCRSSGCGCTTRSSGW